MSILFGDYSISMIIPEFSQGVPAIRESLFIIVQFNIINIPI